jgi:uncharacterized LabA/DUF88 family protein
MHQLHLPAGISFLQRKVQPNQAICDRDGTGRSTRMLRRVGVDRMLVDECRILLCHRVALEVGKYTKALSRGIEPIRYVEMLIGKLQPAAGTLCHRSSHGPLLRYIYEYFEYLIAKYQTHMIFDKDPFLQAVPQKKLAVLIDADNAQPEIIEGLLAEIALYGIASVKRIYGNWTTPNLQPWKEVLLNYSIQPIQQFDYTKGKNATDSALIIDAMDLLYTDKFDGFCIVSSDSDFTRLAQRIRESGLLVYGFGERKTPKPFVQACDKFVYTEILRKTRLTDEQPPETQKETKPGKSLDQLKGDAGLLNLLRSAVDVCSNNDGWANLADVGGNIVNQSPDFDPRNYGYKKLKNLVEATDLFEIDEKKIGDSPAKVVYVKDKKFKTIQFSPTFIRKTLPKGRM